MESFFFLNLTINNAFWDSTLPAPANGVLSVAVLGTILSKILNANIFQLFTSVYVIIFACVPVILYATYEKIFDKKISFFAILFLMFNFYFFNEALLLRRQQVALLFFSLLLLLIVDTKIEYNSKKWIFLISSFALVTSHYAIAFVSIIFFSLAYLLYLGNQNSYIKYFLHHTLLTDHSSEKLKIPSRVKMSSSSCMILGSLTLLLVILAISWYIYISSGKSFSQISMMGANIIDNINLFGDLSSKSSMVSRGFGIGFWDAPFLSQVYRALQYLIQLLLIIGFISYVFFQNKNSSIYTYLATSMFTLLISAIVLPFVSVNIAMVRIYFISLFLLSPFCILGAETILSTTVVFCNRCGACPSRISKSSNISLTLFVIIILIPFFLFNSGLIFEIEENINDIGNEALIPSSDLLSYDKVEPEYYTYSDILSSQWSSEYVPHEITIYASPYASYELISAWSDSSKLFHMGRDIPNNSYILLREWDLQQKKISEIDDRNKRVESNIKGNTHLKIEQRDILYNSKYTEYYGKFSL